MQNWSDNLTLHCDSPQSDKKTKLLTVFQCFRQSGRFLQKKFKHTDCLGGLHISKVLLVSLLPWTSLLMYKICALDQNVALINNSVPFIP